MKTYKEYKNLNIIIFTIIFLFHSSVLFAASIPLSEIQNGYFTEFPQSDGYPNIKKAFENFFQAPIKWGLHERTKSAFFEGIANTESGRVRVRVGFAQYNGQITIDEIIINNDRKYSLASALAPAAARYIGHKGNVMSPVDFLADIYLSDVNMPRSSSTQDYTEYRETNYDEDSMALEIYEAVSSAYFENTLQKGKWKEGKPIKIESVHGGTFVVKTFYAPNQVLQLLETTSGGSRNTYLLRFKSKKFRNILEGLHEGMSTEDFIYFFGEPESKDGEKWSFSYGDSMTANFVIDKGVLKELEVDNFPYEEFPEEVFSMFTYK